MLGIKSGEAQGQQRLVLFQPLEQALRALDLFIQGKQGGPPAY
jgi:hypothetical protein